MDKDTKKNEFHENKYARAYKQNYGKQLAAT